ncbi:hypothetical protein [Roseospira goensis]|uniref:Galactosyltransferase Lgt5 n=1 Tax=Roseospira goensis TaxID=391922 RepID=A0A7W6RY97_9PROT|nr:hypothetical protein [Roseospira goensis]MBB4284799.1 hypothetical protein [Roseospira goensis]
MPGLLVLQSHAPAPPAWMARCVASVRAWAAAGGHAYRCTGDALFDRLPAPLRAKTAGCGAMAADLARLLWIREALAEGTWDRVAWLDADVFVFAGQRLDLRVETTHAFGREVWVEPAGSGLRVRRHVHNAVCVFGPDDPVLPFLIHAVTGLLTRAEVGCVSPQLVGPKLLSHLNGVAAFALVESVGMASPLVLRDLAAGGGPAWDALVGAHAAPLAALNLCASLAGRTVDGVAVTDALLTTAMDRLARPA